MHPPGASVPRSTIQEVLRRHTPELMRIPEVIGTGQGERHGRPVILVLAAHVTPELKARVPQALEGWPVELHETGEVRALPNRK